MIRSKPVAFFLAVALLVIALPAVADTIDLNSTVALGVSYQQSTNNPCIFSQTNCQQGLAYTEYKPDKNGLYSGTQTYTLADLAPVLGTNGSGQLNSFLVGLDVSENNGPQTLSSFTIGVNQTTLYSFSSNQTGNIGATQNPGNGFADWLLSASSVSPFSLGTLGANDSIFFTVSYKDLNDGPEQLFLIPDKQQEPPSSVPEPASVVMVLTGLSGLGVSLRNRFGRK